MATYNLHKEIMCCYVKKSLLQNLEFFLKNNIQKIIGVEDDAKYHITISIEDEFGRLYLDTIDEYKMEKFSEKTNSIFIKSTCYSKDIFELIIRFTSSGTPCIEISVGGDSPKEKAIAIYSKINEIISEHKTYHVFIHHKSVPVILGIVIGISLVVLFVLNKITFGDFASFILIMIACLMILSSYINKIYPMVEFDSNALIRPKKIIHWIVTFLFGLVVVGYLKKILFG